MCWSSGVLTDFYQLVVVKALGWLYGLRLECIRSRRFAGLGSPAKSLAEHTDRAELHRSRKLVTTTRTGALGLCAHSPKRPSAATSADSKTTLAPSGTKSANTAPDILLSRCTSNRVLRYSS